MIYLVFLLSLVTIYLLIGFLIYQHIKIKIQCELTKIFFALTTSSFLSIILYSIFKSSLVSINTITLLLIGLMVIKVGLKKPNMIIKDLKKYSKYLFGFLVVLLALFSWKYFYVFGDTNGLPLVIGLDDHCHTSRAMFFNTYGIETTNLNYLTPPDGVEPFHYFEAWFIAFFQYVFNGNYWLTLQLLVYPFINSLIILGTWCILKKFSNKIIYFALTPMVVFFSGLFLDEILSYNFFQYTYAFGSNSIDEFWGLKFSITYIIIISFIILFLNKRYLLSILTLLYLPIFSITLAPAIFSGVSLIIILNYILKGRFFGKEIRLIHLLIPIILCISILTFYKLNEPTIIQIEMPSGINEIINEFNSFEKLKSKLVISFEKIIHLLIFYLPFLLILFLTKNKINQIQNNSHYNLLNYSFNFLYLISLTSLIFYPTFYFIFSSAEFFFYPTIPILNITLFIAFILCLIVYENKRAYYYILLSFFMISSIFFAYKTINHKINITEIYGTNKYSETYLRNVQEELSKINYKIGAKIEHESQLWASDAVDVIGTYIISLINEPYSLVSMSRNSDTKYINEHHKTLSLSSEYYRFTEQQKINNEFYSYDKSQIDFIEKYGFEFLIISNKVSVPIEILKLSKNIITDENTHEKFITLKNSQ